MKLPISLTNLLLGTSLCAALAAQPYNVTFPGAAWEHAMPECVYMDPADVDAAIAALESVVGTDGVSETMLIRYGYVVWAGPDIANKHIVWSCTKSFMSTCLGLLWDDGRLQPSDLASKYLPEMAEDYPTVTLEQMASFKSGVDVQGGGLFPDEPDYPPQTAFHYSAQAELLARILTKIAGEPLRDLFMRRIGDEIGLTPADFEWRQFDDTPDGIVVNGGAGGINTGVRVSAQGMARFGWLYANGGEWNGKQLISKRYIRYASSVHAPASMPPFKPGDWYSGVLEGRYGLNWWVNGVGRHGEWLWPDAPAGTFAAQGNRNNICIIIPQWKMVLVRLGDDQIIDIDRYNVAFAELRKSIPNVPCVGD